jgi:hypothetical protein
MRGECLSENDLSRHCLGRRPRRWEAINLQFLVPYFLTNSVNFASSYTHTKLDWVPNRKKTKRKKKRNWSRRRGMSVLIPEKEFEKRKPKIMKIKMDTSGVHRPLIRRTSGFKADLHLWLHWAGVLVPIVWAIFFQFFSLQRITATRSFSS